MKLVDLSIRRPVGVIMLVAAALVLGFISLKDLKIDLFPKIDLPIAVVATTYEGAAPQEVEELVTKPIESAVSTIEGLELVQSVSQPSASLVIMQFSFGVSIDQVLIDVREKVDQVSGFLPENANRPNVMRIDPNAIPIATISLSGASLNELQRIAEDTIQPRFERLEGVASASIMGGIERVIRVEVDPNKLKQYGLTGTQVIQALQAENHSVSAGTIERGSQDMAIRIDGQYTSVDDIGNTQLMLQSGDSIRVRDVAEIKDTFKDQSSIVTVNGEETLTFSIMKQSDANTVEVASRVQKLVEELNDKYHERGLELITVMDTSVFITDSIDNIISNMIIGGALAVLILLLFLRSIKSTLVIAFSMPIAVISTFTLMYFTGETLNIMSMGGLALGIGLMIDNSIVILENIFKKRQEGLSMKEAALEGGSELSGAVIAATTTTLVVFLPMVFVQGLASQLFSPLALAVMFALAMSLLVALTLVPMLSSKMLTNVDIQVDGVEPKGFVNKLLERVKEFYGRVLEKALHFRKTVILIVTAVLIGSLALLPALGFELMPAGDSGQIGITITTQSGSTLEETLSVTEEVQKRLEKYEDIIRFQYANVGGDMSGIGFGSSGQSSVMIELVSSSERDIDTQTFIAEVSELLKDVPGADITVQDAGQGISTGSPIQVQIKGDDFAVLNDLSQQIVWALEDIEGTLNVESSISDGSPEVQIIVNRDVATSYGLSYQQVMNEINLAFNGATATRYKEDGSEIDVVVSFPEDQTMTIRDLETMNIRNSQGMDIPLQAVAELRQVQGPSEINRSDQVRGVNVTSDISGRDLGSVYQDIKNYIDQMSLPDGYEVTIGGESEDMIEAFGQLGLALALGIFLIYMVMAIQFESFTHPFVIMFSVPTMVIGIILGLFITNIAMSVVALIGIILLAGIVVNNGIILVDYINILRRRGMDRIEAIIESGKSRLRPILMTSLTTILAMFPMSLGIGEGGELQQPMAVAVIFGLTSSMIFTLVFVPVMYLVIDNMATKTKNFFRRRRKNTDLEEDVSQA